MVEITAPADPELLARYDVAGPRYTSYPTAPRFHDGVGEDHYAGEMAAAADALAPRGLSLYVHLPFCRTVCFYCACNRVITANMERALAYRDRLIAEARLHGALLGGDRLVEQLHFGGGTPTYYADDDLETLVDALGEVFPLAGDDRDFGIEVDPRTVDAARVRRLATMGFNRLSLGVQDFDPRVQQAVNRVQGVDETAAILAAARDARFHSTNIDLIYGLPRQTSSRFLRTLHTVAELRPDRIALYGYAHLPDRFRTQRRIDADELPDAGQRLEMLAAGIDVLTGAGYRYIGMDHFALEDDELARAQDDGTLHRNFQGYAPRGGLDLVPLGASAIGRIGDTYFQNERSVERYSTLVDSGRLPIVRGFRLGRDDRVRADVIEAVMCSGVVDFSRLEARYGIVFREYFASELDALWPLAADGLVQLGPERLEVTSAGRLFLRAIAMPFDAYLSHPSNAGAAYSRVL